MSSVIIVHKVKSNMFASISLGLTIINAPYNYVQEKFPA